VPAEEIQSDPASEILDSDHEDSQLSEPNADQPNEIGELPSPAS
jgi:hypothetical protein